ncbi:hypothetical protein IAR50_007087 [Cryptococcus sp. DSM 104548]
MSSKLLQTESTMTVQLLPMSDSVSGDSTPSSPQTKVKRPWGEQWRHSPWFITFVVTFGLTVDMIACSIIVPVLPYRLEELGYSDVSTLTSWLLLAFSAGMLVCTFPVAYLFHKYPYRRWPLVVAVIGMILSTVLFMLGRPYWTMVLSRTFVGVSSAVIWTVGFALLCENVEPRHVGRQLGFVMSGISIGASIAPYIGGLLYTKIGWLAPFVFCIIILFIDLVLRLCVLERSDIRRFHEKRLGLLAGALNPKLVDGEIVVPDNLGMRGVHFTELSKAERENLYGVVELKPWEVMGTLLRSPRSLTALLVMSAYNLIGGATQPTLPLQVQEVWNKDSAFIGLIFLISAAPALFAGPLAGAASDKWGAEWIMLPCMILVLPWTILNISRDSLAGFIVYFMMGNFFSTCAMTPSGLEATMVARKMEGISEIHLFGALEVASALASGVGNVAGAQLYDHVSWAAVMWFNFAVTLVVVPVLFFFAGAPERTLASRIRTSLSKKWGGGRGIGHHV